MRDIIFDKESKRIDNNSLKNSPKRKIRINFIQDGNVQGRYNECLNDKNLRKHYIADDTYCYRLLYEEKVPYMDSNSWFNQEDVVIEVLNSNGGNKDYGERSTGYLLRTLYDKLTFDSSRVSYRGRIGQLDFNKILSIANEKPYNIATKLTFQPNAPELIYVSRVLKTCIFKRVTEIGIDGNPGNSGLTRLSIDGQELLNSLFKWETYYINNIGMASNNNDIDSRKTSLMYLKRFVNSSVNIYPSKLNKITHVCYFSDENREISELIAYLANDSMCFKDDGKTMSGAKINELKASGKLIYIGDLGANKEDTARKVIQNYLV